MTWEEFQDLIRGHNNVTWRNFNVVDVDLSMATSSFGPYKFKFRGAFDKDRQFDLLVIHPFGDKLLWKIPTASEFWPELKEQLERKALGWEIKQDNLVTVRCPPNLLIEGLTFLKKASYESEFVLEIDNPYDVLDKEFRVSQLYKFPEGPGGWSGSTCTGRTTLAPMAGTIKIPNTRLLELMFPGQRSS